MHRQNDGHFQFLRVFTGEGVEGAGEEKFVEEESGEDEEESKEGYHFFNRT